MGEFSKNQEALWGGQCGELDGEWPSVANILGGSKPTVACAWLALRWSQTEQTVPDFARVFGGGKDSVPQLPRW